METKKKKQFKAGWKKADRRGDAHLDGEHNPSSIANARRHDVESQQALAVPFDIHIRALPVATRRVPVIQ